MISGSKQDPDFYYATRFLFEFKMRPNEYVELDENEKAFMIAAIILKDEEEEAAAKKAEREARA